MKAGSPQSVAALEMEILGYLLRHPSGEDSIEGIVGWWLLEQRIMETKQAVERALAALMRRGFVESRVVGGGPAVYRLNAGRRREAEGAWKRSREEGGRKS